MGSPVGLISLVDYLFSLLYLLIIVRVLLSWVPGALDHPAGYAIYRLTNPILEPVRRLIPPLGGLDISPLIAIVLLGVLKRVVVKLLIALVVGP